MVKPGHVWVEADNHETAGRDSNEYGQLHVKMIVGRVTWLVWPWERVQDMRRTETPRRTQLDDLLNESELEKE